MNKVKSFYRRHPWANTLLICFWALFTYSFGGWWGGWAPPWIGYHRWWWYDDLGHSLYGLMGGITALHIILNYTARGAFLFVGRILVSLVIFSMVMAGAGLFELYEFMWDDYLKPPDRLKGQDGLRDTMIDMWNAFWAAALSLLFWHAGRLLYRIFWPRRSDAEERNKIANDILAASERIRELRRSHWHEVRDRFRERVRKKDPST